MSMCRIVGIVLPSTGYLTHFFKFLIIYYINKNVSPFCTLLVWFSVPRMALTLNFNTGLASFNSLSPFSLCIRHCNKLQSMFPQFEQSLFLKQPPKPRTSSRLSGELRLTSAGLGASRSLSGDAVDGGIFERRFSMENEDWLLFKDLSMVLFERVCWAWIEMFGNILTVI